MKKFLVLLIAMLLYISIPTSAVCKNTDKSKPYKTKAPKTVSVTLTSDTKTINTNGIVTLKAVTKKQGSYLINSVWEVNGSKVTDKNLVSTKLDKSGKYISTFKFIPTQSKNYTIKYSIKMGAGKSDVTFIGSKSIIINPTVQLPSTHSKYEFKIGDIPPSILPGAELNTLVILRTTQKYCLGYNNVAVNVKVSNKSNVQLLTINDNDVLALGYWYPSADLKIGNNYTATANLKAKFSTVGSYAITFDLVDLSNNSQILTSKSIYIIVSNQPSTYVKDFEITHLSTKLQNANDADCTIKVFVNKLSVEYQYGKVNIVLDTPKYIGEFKLSDLKSNDFHLDFSLTYGDYAKVFILYSTQIIQLF